MQFRSRHDAFPLVTIGLVLLECACVGTVASDGSAEPGGGAAGDPGGFGGDLGTESPFSPDDLKTATPPDVRFDCTPDKAQPASLKKLTMTQVTHSLEALIRLAVKDAAVADAIWKGLSPELAALPKDGRPSTERDIHGGFSRLDQLTQQGQIESLYRIAKLVGAEIGKPERRRFVFGDCATDADAGNDSACLGNFVSTFGERVLRHPLTAEEISRFRTIHASNGAFDEAAVADVVGAMLMSPYFLAFVEHGTDIVDESSGAPKLSAFELASELSLHLWNTIPDESLWAAAKSGELLTDAGYGKQVNRLLGDPRADETFKSFAREWLRTENLPTFSGLDKNAAFKFMAGNDMPDAPYVNAVAEDAVTAVHDVFRNGGRAIDLLATRRSFVMNPLLARTYGVDPWSGSGEPVQLPDTRPGILGRAFFLNSGIAKTRPIMRGVFIRTEILCDEIAPPPPNALSDQGLIDKTKSVRDQTVAQTSPSQCAGCHTTFINGLGFAMEGFDALGRERETEVVLDIDTGKVVSTLPVSTTANAFIYDGDEMPVNNVRELVERIGQSGKVPHCLARRAFRFTHGRNEDDETDGCSLEAARAAFDGAQGMRNGWRALVVNPSFRQRAFE